MELIQGKSTHHENVILDIHSKEIAELLSSDYENRRWLYEEGRQTRCPFILSSLKSIAPRALQIRNTQRSNSK